jgi:hypothetical protein
METYIKIGLLIFLIILLILVCNIQKIRESFTNSELITTGNILQKANQQAQNLSTEELINVLNYGGTSSTSLADTLSGLSSSDTDIDTGTEATSSDGTSESTSTSSTDSTGSSSTSSSSSCPADQSTTCCGTSCDDCTQNASATACCPNNCVCYDPSASSSSSSDSTSTVSDTEFNMNDWQNGVLFYNNNIRQQCGTDAGSSVPDLEWDSDLAVYAEEYAQNLATNHGCGFSVDDPHHEDGHDSYAQKDAGENLAMNWGSNLPDRNSNRLDAAKTGVNGWAGEGYSGTPNHYSAMNWNNTTKIGCGIGYGTYTSSGVAGNCYTVACNYKSVAPNSGDYSHVKCTAPYSVSEEYTSEASGLTTTVSTAEENPGSENATGTGVELGSEESGVSVSSNCTTAGSIGSCGNCLETAQCQSGMFCCPYMKKCVASSSTGCNYPIANCSPSCSSSSCTTCSPTDSSTYPSGWQNPTC